MEVMDPKSVGLTLRDEVVRLSDDAVALRVHRKSRLIMADGRRLLEKVETVRRHLPGVEIQILTSAPVCSKTHAFLEEQGIKVNPLS